METLKLLSIADQHKLTRKFRGKSFSLMQARVDTTGKQYSLLWYTLDGKQRVF